MWDDDAFNEDINVLQQLSDRICDVVLLAKVANNTSLNDASTSISTFSDELNLKLSKIVADIRGVATGVGVAFFKGLHRDLVRLFVKGHTYKQQSYSKCEKFIRAENVQAISNHGALTVVQMIALIRVLQFLIPFGGLDRTGTLADVFVRWLSNCSINESSIASGNQNPDSDADQMFFSEYKAALLQLCLSFVTPSRNFAVHVADTALSLAISEVNGATEPWKPTVVNPDGIMMKVLARGITVHTASICDVMLQRLLRYIHA